MKNLSLLLVAIILIGAGCTASSDVVVENFDDCVAAGNPVMESYPQQCRHGDETFTEEIGNELEKFDLIMVDSPRPNQLVESPLSITGQAVGNWYFEATFPVVLVDWDGLIIAEGYATAEGEWMTEDFVPFTATLEFETPDLYNRGSLILQKDNPSGLPEYDDALEIPVKFWD
ncbi:MAG: Gmad2 immunoglobulin-like domain-containing protein [bacterium]